MKKILWLKPSQFIIVLLTGLAGFSLGYFGGSAPDGSIHDTRDLMHIFKFNLTSLGLMLGLVPALILYCLFRAANER